LGLRLLWSGKSSFTKYLGAALDPSKTIHGKPFLDLLCDRFPRNEIPAALRTVSKKYPTAVVLLDLGAEQLAESAAASVSTVLYWKVLQWAGFSKEKKTAQLEFTLDRQGNYDDFKRRYRERYKGEWEEIHNDPLIGVARAAEIVPRSSPTIFLPRKASVACDSKRCVYREPKRGRNDDGARRGAHVT
jgi:hypothetical protein